MHTSPEFYMQQCLNLAENGRGKTHPNPMVGCVVLDKAGQVVGEGYHAAYGEPHAEVMALRQAGEYSRGGTLFVNLEPCSHVGKTPPCANAVIESGIKTVYYGLRDPNPKVAGQGLQRLQESGIKVYGPLLEASCQKLNEAFCHSVVHQTPFVVLKMAMSLDAKIATQNGESQWITNESMRAWVHQLRSQSDAILTTAQSVMADDCVLNVRSAPLLGRPPIRVILDRRWQLDPKQYQIFQPQDNAGPVWVITSSKAIDSSKAHEFKAMGVRLISVPTKQDRLDLKAVLASLGQERITQLMVEAGGTLAGSLLSQGLVNKLWLTVGDQLFLDPQAMAAFSGPVLTRLNQAYKLRYDAVDIKDNNLLIEAYPI